MDRDRKRRKLKMLRAKPLRNFIQTILSNLRPKPDMARVIVLTARFILMSYNNTAIPGVVNVATPFLHLATVDASGYYVRAVMLSFTHFNT